MIRDSPFFPKLRCGTENNGVLNITLEALLLQRNHARHLPSHWATELRIQLSISRILLDIMGALRTLHEAGFVHSDVSVNNIGFNFETGTWQLFDFNQSLPIEESLSTVRRGGTKGYRSLAAEKSGIFRPLDDYIALARTCTGICQCSCSLFDDVGEMMEPFEYFCDTLSSRANPANVDLDKCYLRAFRTFVHQLEANDRRRYTQDPSYKAASAICELIKAKNK
jgi:hypothetical protein